MMEYFFKDLLATYIGGTLRYIYLRYICRKSNTTYRRVLHGIPDARTKEADAYNIKNGMKNRLTTVAFIVTLIIIAVIFDVIP